KDYHIKSIDELRVGLESGNLADALGQVMIKRLSEEVQKLKSGSSRMLLAEAFHLAAQLVSYFEEKGMDVPPAGSLRRGSRTVGAIDIVATGEKAADAFVECAGVD